jgi:hypothetical protein
MVNTVLLNDETRHPEEQVYVHLFRPASDGLNISGNTLVGPGTDAAKLKATGNTAFANRAAAGLPPFPALPPLPPPLGCRAALEALCGTARAVRGRAECAVCCGQHQHVLRAQGCTAEHCGAFCDRPLAWPRALYEGGVYAVEGLSEV